jgi:hypothetical protein
MPRKRTAPSLKFAETYHAAQTFLVHVGATPTSLDEPADGIVEFESEHHYSRLRYDDAPITQGAILALLKHVEDRGKTPILFSASGFTGAAEVFGENLNVALFTITPYGDMTPRSPAAHALMPAEPFEPPFAPVVPDEERDRPPGVWMPGQGGIADHEWLDCAVCGTTHHPEANFCHRCGAALARKNRAIPTSRRRATFDSATTPPPVEVREKATSARRARERSHDHDSAMRCRNCGSTDIEVED